MIIKTVQHFARYWLVYLLVVGFYIGWEHYGNAWTTPVLYAGAAFCGLLYYAFRKRRAFLEAGRTPPNPFKVLWISFCDLYTRIHMLRKWDQACRSEKVVAGREKVVPWLQKIRFNPDGDTASAFVKPTRIGLTTSDIVAASGRISEIIGCREIVCSPGSSVGVALLKFYWSDPLQRLLPVRDMPVTKHPGTIAYGVRRDGSVATLDIDKSLLIGGLTGTGKSSIMWALFADLIRQKIPVALWISDPKGGMELDALEKAVGALGGTFRVERYVRNAKDTVTMVKAFEQALRVRQREQKEAGIRRHTPTEAAPQMILILDELLPLHEMIRKGTASELGAVLFEGRAAGFTVWSNAQVGHATELGTLRNLIVQRVCLGMPTPQATETILGQGAEARGATCSELGQNVKANAGVGYSVDENGRLAKFRAAFVSDRRVDGKPSDIDEIADGRMPASMVTEAVEKITVEPERVAVYKRYTEAGRLLYVGISNKPALRFKQHHREDFVDDCPICLEPCKWWAKHCTPFDTDPRCAPEPAWYKDRATALKVEEAAIRNELPLFNKMHNQGNVFARRARAAAFGHRARRYAARQQVEPQDVLTYLADTKPAKRNRRTPASRPDQPKRRPTQPGTETVWGAE